MDTQIQDELLSAAVVSSFKAYNGFNTCTMEEAARFFDTLQSRKIMTVGEMNRLKEKFSSRLKNGLPDDFATSIERAIAIKMAEIGITAQPVISYLEKRIEALEAGIQQLKSETD